MKSFGPLYAIASTGKIKVWKADVTDKGTLITTHGYLDGAMATDSKEIKGKNIGKKNETTPYDQACSEAQSKMNKKRDEGYKLSQEELKSAPVLKLPMLAHKFTERKHDIVWPAWVQPKLNGVRCLVDVEGNYMSRNGKVYTTLTHLDESVSKILSALGENVELDGEVFRQEWSFQEITRAVKKDRGTTTDYLQLWVFDYTNLELSFSERYTNLRKIFTRLGTVDGQYITVGNVTLVPTFLAKDEEHIKYWHREFTKEGFEGTIIRNQAGKYAYKHRSVDLQKFKDMIDDEYLVIGMHEGTGSDIGTAVFELQTEEGLKFSARPKGSREIRKEYLNNKIKIIGQYATVQYQNLSDAPVGFKQGIPIFPVILEIRNYE